MSKFSILLKEVINQSNNTIYSIAKDINYDRATLTNQINGKRKMSKEIFLKVINNINITENTKQKLISAFHKEYLGENYNTFEIIKKSFISYSEISYLRNINLDMTVTNNTHISIPTGKISGKLYVVSSIQNIIANEFQNDNPCLFINLDTSNRDILAHITKTYTLYSSTKNIKMETIINFFANSNSSIDNFTKFINLLPLLLNGLCPHYCFVENSIKSNMSVLFPFYVISSNHLIIVSQWYDSAFVINDKSMIDFYQSEFKKRINQCKKFTLDSIDLFEMPNLFNTSLDNENENTLYGFGEQFCAMPFLSINELSYMFSDSVKNINTVSSTLLSCYKKINTMISYCPVESIIEFAKSGKDGHTDNPLAKPLTKEMRIDVLKRIQYAINNGMGYYFVNKNNIFCNNQTFNIISDSKIVFFSYDDKIATKQNISVITTPSGLLNELKNFFCTLNKSCYVLSKSDAIRELERGIEFIKNMN